MLIDITLRITKDMISAANGNEAKSLSGHLGTHFDVMDKEFPLEYTERKGIVFDVSAVKDRDIALSDIIEDKISAGMFIVFYTGYIDEVPYGEKRYFTGHPQLSKSLIELLTLKGVAVIGLDFAGMRRGAEHTPMDQYCADRGVFVIENLCSLKELMIKSGGNFTAHIYPMNYSGFTGLPCRVIAEI